MSRFVNNGKLRSGPMRQRLEEPRQVRKEAAAFAMVVCCGVPGLFCVYLTSEIIIVHYFVLHAHLKISTK